MKIITDKDCAPTAKTLYKFISNPSKIIDHCKIFFPVNLMPGSTDSGRLNDAAIIPNKIPNTGPPMIGNWLPKNQAGIAKISVNPMPFNKLIFMLNHLL